MVCLFLTTSWRLDMVVSDLPKKKKDVCTTIVVGDRGLACTWPVDELLTAEIFSPMTDISMRHITAYYLLMLCCECWQEALVIHSMLHAYLLTAGYMYYKCCLAPILSKIDIHNYVKFMVWFITNDKYIHLYNMTHVIVVIISLLVLHMHDDML